jgi:purine-nucleoside phosphorylase
MKAMRHKALRPKDRRKNMQNFCDVQRAATFLRESLSVAAPAPMQGTEPHSKAATAPVGIVLGTGLSGLAETLSDRISVPYADVPGFPVSSVEGHTGAFVWGNFPLECGHDDRCGQPVLIQQGRCHLYEGYSPAQVCMGVRIMAELGVKILIITNAAGALNPQFETGRIMCMTDIINHTGQSPLTGKNYPAWGERFPDMSAPLDADLRALALDAAQQMGFWLERGVYIGVHGPEMETPAETRMYRQWGADAVGMSSVLEIIAARHCGMRVLGLSCLTNKNLPDCMQPAPFHTVLAMAASTQKHLRRLLRVLVTKI